MNEYGVFGSEINQVRAELMVVAKARRNATAKVIKKRAAAKMRAKGKQLHKAKESPQTYEALMSLEERKRKLKEVFHKVMLLNDKFERELHRSLGENTLNSKYREKMSKMIKLDAAQILEGSLAPSPVELSPRHGT